MGLKLKPKARKKENERKKLDVNHLFIWNYAILIKLIEFPNFTKKITNIPVGKVEKFGSPGILSVLTGG